MTNEQRPVVWITGGGSGIGRGLALAYAKSGYRVAVSGRRAERLNEVVAAMGLGQDAGLAVACDVTQPEEVEAAVSRIVDTWGRLDIAVANAGFAVSGRVEELSAEEWRKQLDVNVLGVVHTAKAALPALRDVGGRLALVSSVAGFICTPRTAAYCASKFAVRAIGLTLSQELHGSGVSCTTIYPGFVESEIGQVDNAGRFHGEWEDKRPAGLMWKTEDAVRVMIRAIERRKRQFVFTGHGRFGAWLGQHLPGLTHFLITRRIVRV